MAELLKRIAETLDCYEILSYDLQANPILFEGYNSRAFRHNVTVRSRDNAKIFSKPLGPSRMQAQIRFAFRWKYCIFYIHIHDEYSILKYLFHNTMYYN